MGKKKKDAALKGRRYIFGNLLIPIRELAIVEKSLRGPLAEVDGEGYAVAGVAAEENYVVIFGVGTEEGHELVGEKNRAAPAMCDADVL
jgi:hypothetical protein